MKWSRFLLGIAVGAAAGYMISKAKKPPIVKPEKIVEKMKNQYRQKMAITGSWIHIEPTFEEINGMEYKILHGGISGLVDGKPQVIEFKVDAETGTVLKVEE